MGAGGITASLPLIFGNFLRDIDFFPSFRWVNLPYLWGGGGGNYMEWLKIRHKELFFLQNKLRQDNFCPKLLGFPCETYDSLRYAILQEVLIFLQALTW